MDSCGVYDQDLFKSFTRNYTILEWAKQYTDKLATDCLESSTALSLSDGSQFPCNTLSYHLVQCFYYSFDQLYKNYTLGLIH